MNLAMLATLGELTCHLPTQSEFYTLGLSNKIGSPFANERDRVRNHDQGAARTYTLGPSTSPGAVWPGRSLAHWGVHSRWVRGSAGAAADTDEKHQRDQKNLVHEMTWS